MSANFQEAFALARRGELRQAQGICEALLRLQPDDVDALLLQGVILGQSGDLAGAVHSIRASLQQNPHQAVGNSLLGDALLDSGEADRALQSYEAALALDPRLTAVHFGRANALLDLGRPGEAVGSYDLFLQDQPQHAEAWFNRGNALLALAQLELALTSYERAIAARPDYARAHQNRGSVLLILNRAAEALQSFEAALRIHPADPVAIGQRAAALRSLGRPLEALTAADAALQIDPSLVAALCIRGDLLLELRREDEALEAHALAVRSAPDSVDALQSRAHTLRTLSRFEDALADLERVLELRPGLLPALRMQGDVLVAGGRPDLAVAAYEELLQRDPTAEFAAGALLYAKQSVADWSVGTPAVTRHSVLREVLERKRADSPFAFLAVADSTAAQWQCARTYAAEHCPVVAPRWRRASPARDRIRVAYVSANFRAHALCYLMAGVFEHHDRRRFETIAVSLRPAEDSPMGRRVHAAFERFIDVSKHSDSAVAEMLRALEIDIAVDLTGYTDGLRPRVLAPRPAPIQVSYLGFPGTMGSSHIDYLLADRFVIPPDRQDQYEERVVYLPDCFQANDDRRIVSERVPSRAEEGLPDTGFVFCCFNNGYKVNADVFDVWMRVLERVPDSVLWLLGTTEAARENLRREAGHRGVDARRLIFATRQPYAEHLARLRLADLFLDTAPFNGGTTVSDALWVGLPVLTCSGEAYAARMAGSLLRTVGLAELVTETWADYEATAVALALHASRLGGLRMRLAASGRASALFDTARTCRDIESAYEEMCRRQARGDQPAAFSVTRASNAA